MHTALALVVLLTATACSGPEPSQADEAAAASEAAEVVNATTAGTCAAFERTVADFSMTDEQSAAAFYEIASRTGNEALAAAINRVARGFATHDPAVSAAEVQGLCP